MPSSPISTAAYTQFQMAETSFHSSPLAHRLHQHDQPGTCQCYGAAQTAGRTLGRKVTQSQRQLVSSE
jgi:hypothetical protein